MQMFVALNGPILDDRKGAFAGVASIEYDHNDNYQIRYVKFYPGTAKGHAIQLNPHMGIGYLGSFGATPVLFDLLSGEEAKGKRLLPWDSDRPAKASFFNATHLVWGSEKTQAYAVRNTKQVISHSTCIIPIRDSFYACNFSEMTDKGFSKEIRDQGFLGFHNVPWPHAMKLSASGRYILYGSLDHPNGQPARCIGVFDLQTGKTHIVHLPSTAWHVAVHPTEDVGYAVSENYLSGTGKGNDPFDECSLAINYCANYVFKIDLNLAVQNSPSSVTDMYCFASDEPHHLSADVVSLGDSDDTIVANFCASAQNGVLKLRTKDFQYLDERVILPGWRKRFSYFKSDKTTRELFAQFWQNLKDASCIVNLPTNSHLLVQALRSTNKSLVEGSFGLTVSPQRTRCFSAHRGLNAILVYDMTKPMPWPIIQRIDLPKAYEFLPRHLGLSNQLGLGMHHMTSM